MSKRNYINPALIANAMRVLQAHKVSSPDDKMPLFTVAKDEPETNRAAYVRAAQRLSWNVTRTKGHVYENGFFLW